jgi:tRNA modification GTPase
VNDTIFAVSSGAPPAAIAMMRISGPDADTALNALTTKNLPEPRYAALRMLRAGDDLLDTALVIRFPGPDTATGENIVELHLHGGRATIAAVTAALAQIPGLRPAEPGEFTRRAFENGRIDLSAAEGLSDLLAAETEHQRRSALTMASGGLSRVVERLRGELLAASARVEAAIDYADEDDVSPWPERSAVLEAMAVQIDALLANPPAERLRDGVRVAITGPPNAGKSTLLNVLVSREAAIVSPIAGTTRDVIEVPVVLRGLPFLFIDTAGLRNETGDSIEAIGISRAEAIVGCLARQSGRSTIARRCYLHPRQVRFKRSPSRSTPWHLRQDRRRDRRTHRHYRCCRESTIARRRRHRAQRPTTRGNV